MSELVDRAHSALVQACRQLAQHAEAMVCPRSLEGPILDQRMSEMERVYRHVRMAERVISVWAAESGRAKPVEPEAPAPVNEPPGPVVSSAPSAFTGDTETIPLAKLISFLGMQSKSGVLDIRSRTEQVQIVFDEGALVHAASNNSPPGFRLGEMLVSLGKLDETALQGFLAELNGKSPPLGEALETAGLISQDDLCAVLHAQVQQLFHRLASSSKAEFSFADSVPEGVNRRIRVNVDGLLLESARQQDEAPQV